MTDTVTSIDEAIETVENQIVIIEQQDFMYESGWKAMDSLYETLRHLNEKRRELTGEPT